VRWITVVVVWKWVVKAEKQEEHARMMKKYIKWLKTPPIPKELKSVKAFTQTFGGAYGSYIELIEYESLAAYEKANEKNLKDKEYMEILQEFIRVIEPAQLSIEVWNSMPI
jgi:hypothetical protein